MERFFRRDQQRARDPTGKSRRRLAHFDRDRDFADARFSAQRIARQISQSSMASVRTRWRGWSAGRFGSAEPFTVGAVAGELLSRYLPSGGRVAFFTGWLGTQDHAEKLRGFEASLKAAPGRPIRIGPIVEALAASPIRRMRRPRFDTRPTRTGSAPSHTPGKIGDPTCPFPLPRPRPRPRPLPPSGPPPRGRAGGNGSGSPCWPCRACCTPWT